MQWIRYPTLPQLEVWWFFEKQFRFWAAQTLFSGFHEKTLAGGSDATKQNCFVHRKSDIFLLLKIAGKVEISQKIIFVDSFTKHSSV